jgi:Tyosinase C-terminal domain
MYMSSTYNFGSQFRQSGCQNCKDQVRNKVQATGQIPITGAIIKDYLNDDSVDFPSEGLFNEATLGSYLQTNLTWKVVNVCYFSKFFRQAKLTTA